MGSHYMVRACCSCRPAACSAHAAVASLPAWLVSVGSGGEVAAAPLTEWHRLQQEASSSGGQVYLAVADSSNQPANPGWPLRNLLLMAAVRWEDRAVGSATVQALLPAPSCHFCRESLLPLSHSTASTPPPNLPLQVAVPAAQGAVPAGAARPRGPCRKPLPGCVPARAAPWLCSCCPGRLGAQRAKQGGAADY